MDITRQEWRTLHEVPVPDILGAVGGLVRQGHGVHVGTDARRETRFTEFVVVACVLSPERTGHRVFYTSLRKRRMSLHQKLFWEAWLSTELALALRQRGVDRAEGRIHVHLDVSAQEVHPSSRFLDQLAGLVKGQGFPVRCKPDAWAATHAADQAGRARDGKSL